MKNILYFSMFWIERAIDIIAPGLIVIMLMLGGAVVILSIGLPIFAFFGWKL